MRVRVIKRSNVFRHIGKDKYMSKCFDDFFDKLQYVDWIIPQDITQTFKSADLVTCSSETFNRIVFNIGRNRFRMICGYYFGKNEAILYIKFVGTHKEYDAVDVCKIDMFKVIK